MKELNPTVEDAVYRLVSVTHLLRNFVERTVQDFVERNVYFYKDYAVFVEPEDLFLFLEVTRWVLKEMYGRVPEYEKLIGTLKSKRVEFWSGIFVERSFGYVAVGKTVFKKKYRVEVKGDMLEMEGFKIRVVNNRNDMKFWVRNRKEGDRIIVNGRERKLKDVFIEKKVPTFYRDRVPLLVDEEDRVLWVPGIARSDFCQKMWLWNFWNTLSVM